MKTLRLLALQWIAASIAAAVLAAPALPETALAMVPSDALAVAQVRLDQLRSSGLAPALFHEADAITVDGKAATFLKEAGLDPRRDVDVAVFALCAGGGNDARPLVVFEGRFDPSALSAATLAHGGTKVEASTPYFRLPSPQGKAHRDEPGAVAFVSPTLILAGSEPALLRALDASSGGHVGLSSNDSKYSKGPLAGMVARVDPKSSAWVVVDAARTRELKEASGMHESAEGPAGSVYAALRSVSWIVFQANLSSGGVEVKATGLSSDEEARQNIEDVLRGMIAAWRMAVQSKNPELLSALRKFSIMRDREGVTISGRLPDELFKSAKR